MSRKRIETVYDLAAAAGVSVATVSRVLNGNPKVHEETRERVLALIRESGFRPNVNARRLVGGSSRQICFVLSNRDVVHSFHSRILMGAESYCRQNGYHVVFTTVEYGENQEFSGESLPRVIHEQGGVEGLLLAGVNYPCLLEYLDKARIPYALLGNNLIHGSTALPRTSCVSFDEVGGGEQAAALLAELGHRHIAFVGDLSKPWYRRRHEGYCRALLARGLSGATVDLREDGPAFDLGCRAAPVLLRHHPATTAVFAQDDETACGLMHTLGRLGLRIPEDISLVGYDDITEIRYLNPALTTVRVPKEDIGWQMADRLLGGGKTKSGGAPLLRTEVVIRDSCRKPGPSVKPVSAEKLL